MNTLISIWIFLFTLAFIIFSCRVNYKLNKILEINYDDLSENIRDIYNMVSSFDSTLYYIRKKESKWGEYSRAFDKLFSDIDKRKAESMLQNENTRAMIQCFQIALWMMKEEENEKEETT